MVTWYKLNVNMILNLFNVHAIACEQALHLGDIVKSTRARGSRLRRSLARSRANGELARRLFTIPDTFCAATKIACEQALLFGRVRRVSREHVPRSRVLARLTSLAQMGQLARRLGRKSYLIARVSVHTQKLLPLSDASPARTVQQDICSDRIKVKVMGKVQNTFSSHLCSSVFLRKTR